MEYVIKNKRLKEYLYLLGFNYRTVKDKTNKQKFIYLFKNTKDLKIAITFYTSFKNKQKK